ncbi:MAG: translation initiation factor [Deltaproteobacteria bacterium]|nr:translation initiation factor [Deltaproteobacteria bacterium]
MNKKNKGRRVGVVYSTDPDFVYEHEDDQSPEPEIRLPQQQELRVHLDRKKRRGKEVTLVSHFVGPADDLKVLAKLLKTKCSVGGSVKDGVILIQGDHRDKVLLLLKNEGYTRSKKSG